MECRGASSSSAFERGSLDSREVDRSAVDGSPERNSAFEGEDGSGSESGVSLSPVPVVAVQRLRMINKPLRVARCVGDQL